MPIQLKRAYDAPASSDGYRVLVDRLWPRGLTKEKLHLDAWAKDLAPSNELRKWIHSDMTRWTEFKRRYLKELSSQTDAAAEIRKRARLGTVTLIFATRDPEHNHAAVLKEFLEAR
ncbi:MAG TPA: DUF488 family protein [Anaerolineales bacterium]|nr:DUF488 family protein [Anaerolineales bacterium]